MYEEQKQIPKHDTGWVPLIQNTEDQKNFGLQISFGISAYT
jgi:hypothetical protein